MKGEVQALRWNPTQSVLAVAKTFDMPESSAEPPSQIIVLEIIVVDLKSQRSTALTPISIKKPALGLRWADDGKSILVLHAGDVTCVPLHKPSHRAERRK